MFRAPPGAGKTHLGAEMIVALVRAGKKVGILANSHAVIDKLRIEVCDAAEQGQALKCVQKVNDKRVALVHRFVTNVVGNDDVLAFLKRSINVASGTAWLWSREEMRVSVDVLFVDEAAQISLANVLASAQAAQGVVILGDPQQLDQPLKGCTRRGPIFLRLGTYWASGPRSNPVAVPFFPKHGECIQRSARTSLKSFMRISCAPGQI